MRLIDLDEIEYFTLVDKWGTPRYRIEIGEGLPTVEAIPVEWIRKWNTQHSPIIAGYVAHMILDWEKENDK